MRSKNRSPGTDFDRPRERRGYAALVAVLISLGACAGDHDSTSPVQTATVPEAVQFGRVERRSVRDRLRLDATIRADDDASFVIRAPSDATVLELSAVGATVRPDTIVASLQPPTPIPSPKRMTRGTVIDVARAEALRLDELARLGLVPAARAREAHAHAQQLASAPLLTPRPEPYVIRTLRSGIVVGHVVELGATVDSRDPLLTLRDPTKFSVHALLPEILLADLRRATELRVQVAALPASTLTATLVSVEQADTDRTLALTLALTPAEAELVEPGLSVTLELLSASREALVVPTSALTVHDGATCLVVREGDQFRPQQVEARSLDGAEQHIIELISGVAEGVEIVVEGAELMHTPDATLVRRPGEHIGPWLVVPEGRGARLQLELPTGTTHLSGTRPGRVQLSATALASTSTPLDDVLPAITADEPLRADLVVRREPPRRFRTASWTASGAAAIDALPIVPSESSRGASLVATALRIDAAARFVAADQREPTPTGGERAILPLAGLLLLLAASGSVRAVALTGIIALALEQFAMSPLRAATVLALASVALVVAVHAAATRERRDGALVYGIAQAAITAIVVIVPLGLGRAVMSPPSLLGDLALALGGAIAAAVLLTLTENLLPSGAGLTDAPVERIPETRLALLSLILAVAVSTMVRPPARVTTVEVAGADTLSDTQLHSALDAVARHAIRLGASEILTTSDDVGRVYLSVLGTHPEVIASTIRAAAPPGLGLRTLGVSPPGRRSRLHLPAMTTVDREPPHALGTARALAHGGVRIGKHIVSLVDPDRAGRLPLRRDGGGLTYASEWGGEVVSAPVLDPATARSDIGPWLRTPHALGVLAFLVAISAAALPVVAQRRRGAAPRVAWQNARRQALQALTAAVGGTALASANTAPTTTAASLAFAWGCAVLLARAVASLGYSRRNVTRRRLPAAPGRALPWSMVMNSALTRASDGRSRRLPSRSRNDDSSNA